MAPPAGANGVLPATVLQKNAPPAAPRGPKAAQPKMKLVLRRLPPGLTKTEFETMLGDEWKLGAGKVDWMIFKKGKVSQDRAKPSRPARAYLHVTSQPLITALSDHVRHITFTDAAKSNQDSALIGPPSLEFAPYHRMPGGRRKNDPRQGTIDQDQEFKDFLESLTNPITKPPAPEADASKEVKIKTTPLIEALREKKASKEKPPPKIARSARGDAKGDNTEKSEKKILAKGGKDTPVGASEKGRRSAKAERAAKEAVKVLTKEASGQKDSTAASAAKSASAAASPSPAPERKRGNVQNVKSMLQRDLGLAPASSRRRGTKREVGSAAATPSASAQPDEGPSKPKAKEAPAGAVAATEKATPASLKKPSRAERRAFKATLADKTNSKNNTEDQKPQAQAQPKTAAAPTILKKPQASPAPTTPKGPAASRAPPTEPSAARNAAPQTQAKVESTTPARQQAAAGGGASTTGRQAFLKHANPSQGITEPLIEEALKVFGAIEKVEIDKRKGFAYVDFKESEGLQKAIAASPVKVAQGAVQVLERKEKVPRRAHPVPHGPPTGPAPRGRGGFAGRGRGGRSGGRGGHAGVGGDATPAVPGTPAPTPAATPATAKT